MRDPSSFLAEPNFSFRFVVLLLALAPVGPARPQDNPAGVAFTAIAAESHDTSPPLREVAGEPFAARDCDRPELRNPQPATGAEAPDAVVEDGRAPAAMPATILTFDGIPFASSYCSCAPPDPGGEAGATQYLQVVNEALQVFDKATGASLLGPVALASLWTGFGGDCESNSLGQPIGLYDQLAGRWLVAHIAGPDYTAYTQLCVAVSASEDATGAWHRYDFTLGGEDYALPKLGVWPDAYYVATMVFSPPTDSLLGPQPFALDRAAMLAGLPAMQVSPGRLPSNLGYLLPADLDGSLPPPPGGLHPWIETAGSSWSIFRFDPDFSTPGESTWTLAGALTPAAFTALWATVPQKDTGWTLPGLGGEPMYRLAYRRFPDGHDALFGNLTVSSGGVAAIRWWEIHDATSGAPAFVQEGTYQPDSTWRWLGSAALDHAGDLAIGFSASSSSIYPQIRYAGRLAGDPAGTLGQGEATLHAGTGSQINTGSYNPWGFHSHLAVDPVDDCTFWYTNEYYATTSAFNWRTRIGSFKFPDCAIVPTFALDVQPERRGVCAPANATWSISLLSVGGFAGSTTLSATGQPANASVQFAPNPVSPPGTSTLTVGNTGAAAPGTYVLDVQGTASGSVDRHRTVRLDLSNGVPGASLLIAPANGAIAQSVLPTFSWTAAQLPATYTLEIATDAGFTAIVHSAAGLASASYSGAALETSTVYYWRVRGENACGVGANSAVYSFTTVAGSGDCPPGASSTTYSEGFESGMGGWTHSGTGDTWALSAANPYAGAQSFFASDPANVSDQRLLSPPLAIPVAPLVLFRFWNWQHLETNTTGGCYDGGLLEISTNGGTGWTQIDGVSLLTDPYDGPIYTGVGNPLAGLQAWCGNNPQLYLDSVIDVTPWAGQMAQFRFRLGSDSSVAKPGWYIDDVRLETCTATTIFADGFESGGFGAWSLFTP